MDDLERELGEPRASTEASSPPKSRRPVKIADRDISTARDQAVRQVADAEAHADQAGQNATRAHQAEAAVVIRAEHAETAAADETARILSLIEPMLAAPARDVPANADDWAAEAKWGGVIAYISGDTAVLRGRNGSDVTGSYPGLADRRPSAGRHRRVDPPGPGRRGSSTPASPRPGALSTESRLCAPCRLCLQRQ
jgi:ATP-dependent DNA ligase